MDTFRDDVSNVYLIIIIILYFFYFLFFQVGLFRFSYFSLYLPDRKSLSGNITRSKTAINFCFFFAFVVNASEDLQISRMEWNIQRNEEKFRG